MLRDRNWPKSEPIPTNDIEFVLACRCEPLPFFAEVKQSGIHKNKIASGLAKKRARPSQRHD